MRSHWIVGCLLIASLEAQRTLIVDPTRPGYYTTLNAAVAAAADGDTILIVRTPQPYLQVAPLTITKSLKIIGEDVSLVAGPITISLAAGKDLVFAGCALGWGLFRLPLDLRIENCQGRVTLLDATLLASSPNATIRNSSQVLISMRQAYGPVEAYAQWLAPMVIENSHVVFDRCAITGAHGDYESQFFPSEAVVATRSTVEFIDCTIRGGNGSTRGYPPSWSGRRAMSLTDSSVSFRGAGMLVASGSLTNDPPILASGCTLQHEPGFQAAMALTATSVVVRHLPSVSVAGLPHGPSGTLTVNSAPGVLAALLVGFPADRTTMPQAGSLWLDPATACVGVLGVQNGALAWSFTVPGRPILTGTQIRWQSAAVTGGNFELSAPGATFFR